MDKSLLFIFSIISLFIYLTACKDERSDKIFTGLKVYKEFDKSRKFDTISETSPMHFRPVKIDLYYPSTEVPAHAPLLYGDILDMYGQRTDYNTPIDTFKKLSLDVAKATADYLHVDSANKYLIYKTGIFNSLKNPEKRLPLIIYAAGMNGSSWENVILFDSLAKAGYVVAAISSVGKFPGYMSTPGDLNEQVEDILWVKNRLSELSFVDTSKIGLLSWSLGGSAIGKAAMLSNSFKCLLSFDRTEIHYYGFNKEWDKDFDEILNIAPYRPAAINIPYMYLSGQHPTNIDSIYNIMTAVSSKDKYFLKFNKGTHEDFSSIIAIAKEIAPELGNIDNDRHKIIIDLSLTFFDQYLNNNKTKTISSCISKLVKEHPTLYSLEYPEK